MLNYHSLITVTSLLVGCNIDITSSFILPAALTKTKPSKMPHLRHLHIDTVFIGIPKAAANDDNNDKISDVAMKFGGSSLANADRIDYVAKLIKDQITTQNVRPRAVVCSAMGKTTNGLLAAGDAALNDGVVNLDSVRSLAVNTCKVFNFPSATTEEIEDLLDECEKMLHGVKLIQELSPKTLDQLVSYGERMSVRIMAARLNQIGVPAVAYDSWDIGMITNSNFGDATILPTSNDEMNDAFSNRIDPNVVAVVTGFIGKDRDGKITTLGRSGSDLTATAIGAACNLDEVQFWKDVDGILTSDPRLVPNAKCVKTVDYEEAAELAYFGAQVLHPIAMQPAMSINLPLRVKNSYNPSVDGTVITKLDEEHKNMVTAITYKKGVTLMDVHSAHMVGAYDFLAEVFDTFEKHKIVVDALASSEVSVSLTLDKKQSKDDIRKVCDELRPHSTVTLHEDKSILTLITDVKRSSEVLATVFRVFSTQNINVEMMSQGASKVNISFVIPEDQIEKAVLNLHKCFFEDECIIEPYDPTTDGSQDELANDLGPKIAKVLKEENEQNISLEEKNGAILSAFE